METLLGPEIKHFIDVIKVQSHEDLAEVLVPEKDEMAEQVFNDRLFCNCQWWSPMIFSALMILPLMIIL
jgi:hypothetical protein